MIPTETPTPSSGAPPLSPPATAPTPPPSASTPPLQLLTQLLQQTRRSHEELTAKTARLLATTEASLQNLHDEMASVARTMDELATQLRQAAESNQASAATVSSTVEAVMQQLQEQDRSRSARTDRILTGLETAAVAMASLTVESQQANRQLREEMAQATARLAEATRHQQEQMNEQTQLVARLERMAGESPFKRRLKTFTLIILANACTMWWINSKLSPQLVLNQEITEQALGFQSLKRDLSHLPALRRQEILTEIGNAGRSSTLSPDTSHR